MLGAVSRGTVEAMSKIAVIGPGKIGEALIGGLISGGVEPKDIHIGHRRPERGVELHDAYGVQDFTDNSQAVEGVDVVFLCVKPKQIVGVLEELAETLDSNDATTVVSMAAGISNRTMEDAISAGAAVVRVMPNTPMLVGHGMSAIAPGRYTSQDEVSAVAELLSMVGDTEVVSEDQLDAVTAMSGSSPAYLFMVAEALIDAGVNLGLPRDLAQRLAVSSLAGAGALMAGSEKDPVQLRADVSSPGGTTVAAIRALEENGLRTAFYRGAEACARRSAEMGAPAPSKAPDAEDDSENAEGARP